MKFNRRKFIKSTTLISAGAIVMPLKNYAGMKKGILPKEGLKLSFEPYNLQLKHVFTLANSSRSTTPVMLTKIEFQGITGYGEASMPPYLLSGWTKSWNMWTTVVWEIPPQKHQST